MSALETYIEKREKAYEVSHEFIAAHAVICVVSKLLERDREESNLEQATEEAGLDLSQWLTYNEIQDLAKRLKAAFKEQHNAYKALSEVQLRAVKEPVELTIGKRSLVYLIVVKGEGDGDEMYYSDADLY